MGTNLSPLQERHFFAVERGNVPETREIVQNQGKQLLGTSLSLLETVDECSAEFFVQDFSDL